MKKCGFSKNYFCLCFVCEGAAEKRTDWSEIVKEVLNSAQKNSSYPTYF